MSLLIAASIAQKEFNSSVAVGGMVKCPLEAKDPVFETRVQALIRRVRTRDRSLDRGCWKATLDRYGIEPRHYLAYLDSPEEAALPAAILAASNDRVSPEFLLAVAMREGLVKYFKHGGKRAERGELPVDGFYQLGTDDIGRNASMLIREGYLRPDYAENVDFIPYLQWNEEIHQNVLTAKFAGLKPAIEAVAAELTWRRDMMTADFWAVHGEDAERELSGAQRDYLNYVYYNTKPEARKRILEKTRPGKIARWTGDPRGDGDGYSTNARSNALLTIATSEYFRCVGVFHEDPERN